MNLSQNQISNRKPLQTTPFTELPLGAILPSGWLKDQLTIQADGFTGNLPEHWEYLGTNSGWLGGTGESWERGPYYLDGLLPLAYLLQDKTLIEKTKPWIEWTLSSQRSDGQFGPLGNDDWWSRMVMMKVLIQYEEATGDERVIPFLLKYLRYQLDNLANRPFTDWANPRAGENLLCIHWVYKRTEEAFLLELAEKVHGQSFDWTRIFNAFPFWRYQTKFDHHIHVVNVAMGLKEPALYYLHSGNPIHRDAAQKGIESLMTYHGQLHGMFSGDEWLAGTHPSQGVELCAVVEYMYTLEHLVRILGEGMYGDMLEKVAFNALPATISADWTSHQYVQQVNQVKCTVEHRNWTENRDDANSFGLEPNFGCCTANMHQGWPKLVSHLWMGTRDGGVAAISYAPCSVKTLVAEGVQLELTIKTEYPFRDDIAVQLKLERSAEFPLKLRIPAWCQHPMVTINGEKQEISTVSGFAKLDRIWQDKDLIHIHFPMEVQLEQRGNNAVGIQRGPLVFALPIEEIWHRRSGNLPFANWEVVPASNTPWNFGLQIDKSKPNDSFQLEIGSMTKQPFLTKHSPIRLKGLGRRIPNWSLHQNSADEPPLSPVHSKEPLEEIVLVPYASAKLRIAEFPVVKGDVQ